MEEVVFKDRKFKKLVALVVLFAVLGAGTLSARVVASETLTIHAYIPAKTTVAIDNMGQVQFSSNVSTAKVDVAQLTDATLLSVTAL